MLNDFSDIAASKNLDYLIDGNRTQIIKVFPPGNLVIVITIPDGIFEWFIDVYDDKNNKLVSDWDECFGEEISVLIAERQKAIELFIDVLQKNKLRFSTVQKGLKQTPTIEILKNGNWVELFSHWRE